MLEAIGISPDKYEFLDPVFRSLRKDMAFTGGRYVTGLPLENGSKDRLLSIERLVSKHLCNINYKLSGNPDLKALYGGVSGLMFESGVIETVPSEEIDSSRPQFYMPHRPVVCEDKLITKVHHVFNASAKG